MVIHDLPWVLHDLVNIVLPLLTAEYADACASPQGGSISCKDLPLTDANYNAGFHASRSRYQQCMHEMRCEANSNEYDHPPYLPPVVTCTPLSTPTPLTPPHAPAS